MVTEQGNAVAGFEELRRNVERLRAFTQAGDAGAAHRISGSDDEGLVEVTLSPSGDVEAVTLDPDWRDALGEDGLGSAIVTALQAATSSRMAEWADAVKEDEDVPGRSVPEELLPLPGLAETEPGHPSSPDAVEEAHRMLDLVRSAHSQVDSMKQMLLLVGTQASAVSTPDRAVTVTTSGPNITGIQLNERWVHHTGDRQIADAVRDAIRGVGAGAAQKQADILAQFPEIAEIRQLAANPADLLRRLGTIR